MRTGRVGRDHYRLGGGFCGLGTPVVSYAPLPMLIDVSGLVIINLWMKLWRRGSVSQF